MLYAPAVLALHSRTVKGIYRLKLHKVILIVDGEHYDCSVTFKIFNQNIKNTLTIGYKLQGSEK